MADIPFWATEQLRLRRTFDAWVTQEIDRYESEGFDKLFGDKGGHALDEAGGYTREFVAAYCLSGDERIPAFMKTFRDDWHAAVGAAGHFYHGYDANEHGDYVTHTAEAYSQFLLNVLYVDPSDETTVVMVEDGAEHLGNYSDDVHDWYDWDRHIFHTYFPGTKMNAFHGPPWNFQASTHWRLLAIGVAAYDVTRDPRYLDVACDYCDFWAEQILAAADDDDMPVTVFPYGEAVAAEARAKWGPDHPPAGPEGKPDILQARWDCYLSGDWHENKPRTLADFKALDGSRHIFHDQTVTWLEVCRHAPKPEYAAALQRIFRAWIGWYPDRMSTQLAGIEPHCGLHLPKYRDVTGDTSLDETYLANWPVGVPAYLLTGDEDRLLGRASAAEAVFAQTLYRNSMPNFACNHACNMLSNAGCSSAYVAPALFLPAFGGLNVHYGRAPWVDVLYYTGGRIGLPADVAALYVPSAGGHPCGVRLCNTGSKPCTISLRPVEMSRPARLLLTEAAREGLAEVTVEGGQEQCVDL